MFPSSALFAAINCPFSQRGLCERPHCLYKHVKGCRDVFVFGASNKSSIVDFTGVQNDCPNADTGAPVNDMMKDECLQELERINKEIESVRHEVELEQRRLSLYQTVKADNGNATVNLEVSGSETAGKSLERGSHGFSSHTNIDKTHCRASKYVVDNSKPRTDLEYDPLSNFSADLRSYSSSGKEHGVKKGQGLKMARNAVPCNQKKSVTDQAPLSQLPPDDSNEDGVLIIDIPPSPDKKMGRDEKPLDSLKDKEEEMKEVKSMPSLLNSPPLHIANDTSPPASMVQENGVHSDCAQNNQGQSNFYENKECKNKPADGSIIDFPGCLGNLGRDAQKMACFQAAENEVENSLKPTSPPAITHQRGQKWNSLVVERIENAFLAELPHCDLIRGVGKINPLHISNYPANNSLFSKAAAASSDSQHSKQAQTTEPPVQSTVRNRCSSANAPSVLPHSQKASNKTPEQMQGKAAVNHAPTESHSRLVEPAPGSTRAWSASSLTPRAEPSFASAERHLETVDNEVIVIDSSSEDELNYSEMELSDSDPMEECFRIFMEGNDKQPDVSVGCVGAEKPELKVKPQEMSGKKRVAHETKHMEQPLAKSRPQPQVLVPLCVPAVSGFGSQPSITSRIQQMHQRASVLTASIRGGQALISSTCQRRPEAKRTPAPSAQTPANLLAAPVQSAYMNCIPLGTTVIEVGNNLHLILPEGAFPLPATSISSPAISLLTPISHVQASAVVVKQAYHPPAVTAVQRYRTSVPLIIPAPARKPASTSVLAHSSPATSAAAAPSTVIANVKPAATKRKSRQQSEAIKEKVPHDIRQRYVNMFTEEFLKTTANVNEAFEKALAEERTVYNRSVNKFKYLSIAVNALKRLKNQSAFAAKDQSEVNSQRLKGNIPLNLKKSTRNDDMAFYESLRDYVLTEDRLIESNYPIQHPEKPSSAVLFADNKKCNSDPLKRMCCRCGATYSVSLIGKHIRKEECNYHYGKGVKKRVPGGVETRYSCCEGVMGAPGCQVFKLHVHDSLGLDGFASTVPRHPLDTSCPGVYSLDCEMCYTIHGLELSRVTLVNSSLQVVYDTFVTPDNEVIDYNTRFSGIGEEDVKDNRTYLKEVQETLLSFVSSDTVLIGHGLETDLCALKLLHGKVVDTSVVFPHHLGPPHKLTLNRLTAEYLRRIIQESVCGHDTAEDAAACMELMLWKVKEDGKLKK